MRGVCLLDIRCFMRDARRRDGMIGPPGTPDSGTLTARHARLPYVVATMRGGMDWLPASAIHHPTMNCEATCPQHDCGND